MLDGLTQVGVKKVMELHELILERRTELGWSQAELAEKAGHGVKQQDVDRIERGITKNSKHFVPIRVALGITTEGLVEWADREVDRRKPLPKREDRGRLVPVYASTEGGDGSLVVPSDPVEYAPRPNIVENEDDLYGVVVEGTSMIKAYRPGDTAWLHPKYRERRDEPCVFRRYNETTGDVSMTIKWLVDFNSERWKVEQFNPYKEFELKREDWPECYRVLGKKNRA